MFSTFALFDSLARWIVEGPFGLSVQSRLGASLHFFFYDVPKVLALVLAVSFPVGVLQTWLEPESVRRWLGGKRSVIGNMLAAATGIVTPFCSCSAVPRFIGFLEGGVPLGVTFSYLIAAPMVNEVAVALLWGLFGFKVTAIYIGFGSTASMDHRRITLRDRLAEGWRSSRSIFVKVWPYVVGGIGVGSLIHGYVPEAVIVRWAGPENWFAVPLAVAIGVPLYANIAGVLPITEALVNKGLPLGTVLAFTMAVTALSLPEMIILRKVLRPPLLAVFVGLLTIGIIGDGYLFNALLG